MSENKSSGSRFADVASSARKIQSYEKTGTNVSPSKTVRARTMGTHGNRTGLLLATVPFIGVVLWCSGAMAMRTLTEWIHSPGTPVSARQAKHTASTLLKPIVGDSVSSEDLQVARETAFSVRRKTTIAAWDVMYSAGEGKSFLVRVNSRTGNVFAINQVDEQQSPLSIGRPAGTEHYPIMTRTQAQMRVSQILENMRFEQTNLTLVSISDHKLGKIDADMGSFDPDNVYTFTYRQSISGMGPRILKIAIDRNSGELRYFWNPFAAV